MDGFIAVSWKKTPCFGRAPQQVAQRTGEQRSWYSQQRIVLTHISATIGRLNYSQIWGN